MPGFQSFFSDFSPHFVLAKLATNCIKFKEYWEGTRTLPTGLCVGEHVAML